MTITDDDQAKDDDTGVFYVPEMDIPDRAPSPILQIEYERNKVKKHEMIGNGFKNGRHKIYHIPIVSTVIVDVLTVFSPNEIWVRPFNHITENLIIQEPTDFGKEIVQMKSEDITMDMYCMAPLSTIPVCEEHEDFPVRRYGRARIVAVNDPSPKPGEEVDPEAHRMACVFYIDEGKREWVMADCLAKLPDDFCYHPWQAIQISLGGVYPKSLEADPAEYWLEDDVIALREIVDLYPVFCAGAIKNTRTTNDSNLPILVNLVGLKDSKWDGSTDDGICIASQLVAKRRQFMTRSKVYNAEVYQGYKNPKIVKEYYIPPECRSFPSDWRTVKIHDWQRKQRMNEYKQGEERGWLYNPSQDCYQIKHIGMEYLNKNKYYENGAYTFCILGSYTKHPYEFYGMPIRTLGDNGEELPCCQSMSEVYVERKNKARLLDSFYSNKDNRFALEKADVIEWLEKGLRVYAIAHCQLDKRSKAGNWQRVEILSVDEIFYRIRYIDSGGQARVQIDSLFKILDEHCIWTALAVQLCWHGVKDANPDAARNNTFCADAVIEFQRNFRDDGPVKMNVYGQNPKFANTIYKPAEAPVIYEMWNTMFISNIQLCASSVAQEETNLLTILKFGGMPKSGRLIEDSSAPCELWSEPKSENHVAQSDPNA